MAEPKIHKRSIRLFNNAGIDFPACYFGEGPLDMEKGRLPTSPHKDEVTCKRCLKKMARNRWT